MALSKENSERQFQTNDWPMPLDCGEIVTLKLGDAGSECMVFQKTKNDSILIPLQLDTSLQRNLDKLPIVGKITSNSGVTSDISINSQQPLTALNGTLGPAEYAGNQRQWYRVHLNYKAELSANGRSWRNMCGENISEGGLLVSAHKIPELSIGQAVFLRVILPGIEPIMASGVVRRIDILQSDSPQATAKVRIRFTNISARDTHRLTQFIYKCQANQSDRF